MVTNQNTFVLMGISGSHCWEPFRLISFRLLLVFLASNDTVFMPTDSTTGHCHVGDTAGLAAIQSNICRESPWKCIHINHIVPCPHFLLMDTQQRSFSSESASVHLKQGYQLLAFYLLLLEHPNIKLTFLEKAG